MKIDHASKRAFGYGRDHRKEPGLTMEPLLTVKDAAELLSCSEAAIRKWLYQRRLPKVKVGRLTRIRRSDVEDLVANGLPES